MDLISRLRERLKAEFEIETDEQLMEAVDELDLDLGVFVRPIGGEINAKAV